MKQSKELTKTTQELMEKYKVPGMMISIAQDGETVFSEGFGFRNAEESLEVNEETVFGLASITKSFTSVAVMHLQEMGKINVTDPVIKYLPEFYVKDEEKLKQITVHHFLTHSSGLPPMSSLEYAMKRQDENDPTGYRHFGEDKDQKLIDTYEQLLKYIQSAEVNLIGEPGEHFSYSNEGYGLLGLIIERVSGKSYKEYVYDHIVKPCKMKNTYFTMEEYGSYTNISTSYGKNSNQEDAKVEPDLHWIDSVPMRSTGFLKSTATDMLKFAEIFRNGGLVHGTRIISNESVEEIMTPHAKVQLGRYYGYGLSIVPDYFGNKLVEHGGSLRSVSSKFCVIPEKGVSGVIFANLIGVPVTDLFQKYLNHYFGRDMNASHMEHKEYNVEFKKMQHYEGEYSSDEGVQITLSIENDKFVFIRNNEAFPTMFIRENVFIVYFEDTHSIVEVLLDKNNQPYALKYNTRIVHKRK